MKHFIFTIILVISIFFCQAQQKLKFPFPPVQLDIFYTQVSIEMYPVYIVFNKNPNFYTCYHSYGAMFGGWKKHGDTLFLYPYTEYYAGGGGDSLYINEIEINSCEDYTINNIPLQYLIKGDNMVDITDYEFFFNCSIIRDLMKNEHLRSNFTRLKKDDYLPVFPQISTNHISP